MKNRVCQKMIAQILEWFLYCSITHRIKSSVCWEFTEGSSYCGRFKFKAALAKKKKKKKKWLYVSTTFVIRSRIKSFLISVILLKLYVFPTRFVLINLLMIKVVIVICISFSGKWHAQVLWFSCKVLWELLFKNLFLILVQFIIASKIFLFINRL